MTLDDGAEERASPAARAVAAVLAARIAFGVAFLAAWFGRVRVPLYLPVERRWTFEPPAGVVAMAWYGTTALAVVAGALGFGAAWLMTGWSPIATRLGRPGATLPIARAAAMVLLVDFLYFGWTMSHQLPGGR